MTQYDELNKYLRQEEPDKLNRGVAWATAIGLQDVDGLTTSKYLRETALRNIEGEISIDEAQKLIHTYYESKDNRERGNSENEEADKVSANIAELLGEKAFVFSPMGLISVHRRIFKGVFSHAGKIRDYNITKKEWVLNGDTVLYSPASEIMATLNYDFGEEKKFNYNGLNIDQIIAHIIQFVSGLWQIHPFREGNTRTTAVFLIKYLRSLGFNIGNKTFAENSWFFRNSLVRANVKNPAKGIEQTDEFLKLFFENLLKGTNHQLKNRFTHINYKGEKHTLRSDQTGDRPSDRPSDQALSIMKLLIDGPKSRVEIMKVLDLKHLPTFRKNYLHNALENGWIELTIPANPTDSRQQYRLTDKGREYIKGAFPCKF
ncbi:MAG: Fic family protein [Muribaculaceae bacterium]|nr:Fic family protein [Muribaculaceae bacterium]